MFSPLFRRLSALLPVFVLAGACTGWQPVADSPAPAAPSTRSVTELVRKMDDALTLTRSDLEKARGAIHLRRMVCVSEALDAMQVVVQLAHGHHHRLKRATNAGDRDTQSAALHDILEAHERVGILRVKVRRCGGERPNA